jgi:hypothetical protein
LTDPSLLNLFGAILGIVGSVLLTVDALGAPDFLAALSSEQVAVQRMARLGFRAMLNRTFLYIMVSLISFLVTLAIIRDDLVLALLLAPWPYFGWQALAWASKKFQGLVQGWSPAYQRGHTGWRAVLGCLGWLISWPPWAIVFTFAFLTASLIDFGVTIPLYSISERVIEPLVERLYQATAKAVNEEKRWHFKRNAFVGTLFILFGFLYQFLASLIQLEI